MTALRQTVRDFLRCREYDPVLGMSDRGGRLTRAIVSLLYDGEELIRWRAVTMIGRLAVSRPQAVRPLITRFIWWMNDESGGIGWSSAPALGEIGRSAPALLGDTARVVIHWRHERILFPGVIWAIGRLAPAFRPEALKVVPDLIGFLEDGDAEVRGKAAWALGEVGDPGAEGALKELLADTGKIILYEEEGLSETQVGTISAGALKKLSAG